MKIIIATLITLTLISCKDQTVSDTDHYDRACSQTTMNYVGNGNYIFTYTGENIDIRFPAFNIEVEDWSDCKETKSKKVCNKKRSYYAASVKYYSSETWSYPSIYSEVSAIKYTKLSKHTYLLSFPSGIYDNGELKTVHDRKGVFMRYKTINVDPLSTELVERMFTREECRYSYGI